MALTLPTQPAPIPPLPVADAPGNEFQALAAEMSSSIEPHMSALADAVSAFHERGQGGLASVAGLGNDLAVGQDEFNSLSSEIDTVDFTDDISAAQSADQFLASTSDNVDTMAAPESWAIDSLAVPPVPPAPPAGGNIGGTLSFSQALQTAEHDLAAAASAVANAIGAAIDFIMASPYLIVALFAAFVWLGYKTGLNLWHFFLHGADPNQVPASEAEQTFEAASDDFYRLQRAGYLTHDEAVQAQADTLASGQKVINDLLAGNARVQADKRPWENALANMTKVITEEGHAAELWPDAPAIAWDAVAAAKLYVTHAAEPGWYQVSTENATKMVSTYMNKLRGTLTAANVAQSPTSTPTSAPATKPPEVPRLPVLPFRPGGIR